MPSPDPIAGAGGRQAGDSHLMPLAAAPHTHTTVNPTTANTTKRTSKVETTYTLTQRSAAASQPAGRTKDR